MELQPNISSTTTEAGTATATPNVREESMAVHERLLEWLNGAGAVMQLLTHGPCRTSAESAAARTSAGVPDAVGAKALLVRTDDKSLVLLVLPGNRRLDGKAARKAIGRGFRFCTPEEMAAATSGLTFGIMPPFARPLFDAIPELYVDNAVVDAGLIGFNAACITRSVVMSGADYSRVASPTGVVRIAE